MDFLPSSRFLSIEHVKTLFIKTPFTFMIREDLHLRYQLLMETEDKPKQFEYQEKHEHFKILEWRYWNRVFARTWNGWSHDIATIIIFGRNISGLLNHEVSNSHIQSDSTKKLTTMIFFIPLIPPKTRRL